MYVGAQVHNIASVGRLCTLWIAVYDDTVTCNSNMHAWIVYIHITRVQDECRCTDYMYGGGSYTWCALGSTYILIMSTMHMWTFNTVSPRFSKYTCMYVSGMKSLVRIWVVGFMSMVAGRYCMLSGFGKTVFFPACTPPHPNLLSSNPIESSLLRSHESTWNPMCIKCALSPIHIETGLHYYSWFTWGYSYHEVFGLLVGLAFCDLWCVLYY